MIASPERWLAQLSPDLSPQAAVIRGLLDESRADSRIRLFLVGCSLGRGVGDEHSDVDGMIAVLPEAWASYADDIPGMLRRIGPVIDEHHTLLTYPNGDPYRSTWALFGDGTLLELVIWQAKDEVHPGADWVVLCMTPIAA